MTTIPTMYDHKGLTEHEARVVDLVCDGMSNKQIGAALGISIHTARAHIRNIMEKTGQPNRVALALWFARLKEPRAPRPLYLTWDGEEYRDTRCGCRYCPEPFPHVVSEDCPVHGVRR